MITTRQRIILFSLGGLCLLCQPNVQMIEPATHNPDHRASIRLEARCREDCDRPLRSTTSPARSDFSAAYASDPEEPEPDLHEGPTTQEAALGLYDLLYDLVIGGSLMQEDSIGEGNSESPLRQERNTVPDSPQHKTPIKLMSNAYWRGNELLQTLYSYAGNEVPPEFLVAVFQLSGVEGEEMQFPAGSLDGLTDLERMQVCRSARGDGWGIVYQLVLGLREPIPDEPHDLTYYLNEDSEAYFRQSLKQMFEDTYLTFKAAGRYHPQITVLRYLAETAGAEDGGFVEFLQMELEQRENLDPELKNAMFTVWDMMYATNISLTYTCVDDLYGAMRDGGPKTRRTAESILQSLLGSEDLLKPEEYGP